MWGKAARAPRQATKPSRRTAEQTQNQNTGTPQALPHHPLPDLDPPLPKWERRERSSPGRAGAGERRGADPGRARPRASSSGGLQPPRPDPKRPRSAAGPGPEAPLSAPYGGRGGWQRPARPRRLPRALPARRSPLPAAAAGPTARRTAARQPSSSSAAAGASQRHRLPERLHFLFCPPRPLGAAAAGPNAAAPV